jgi:hypothetical protein
MNRPALASLPLLVLLLAACGGSGVDADASGSAVGVPDRGRDLASGSVESDEPGEGEAGEPGEPDAPGGAGDPNAARLVSVRMIPTQPTWLVGSDPVYVNVVKRDTFYTSPTFSFAIDAPASVQAAHPSCTGPADTKALTGPMACNEGPIVGKAAKLAPGDSVRVRFQIDAKNLMGSDPSCAFETTWTFDGAAFVLDEAPTTEGYWTCSNKLLVTRVAYRLDAVLQ